MWCRHDVFPYSPIELGHESLNSDATTKGSPSHLARPANVQDDEFMGIDIRELRSRLVASTACPNASLMRVACGQRAIYSVRREVAIRGSINECTNIIRTSKCMLTVLVASTGTTSKISRLVSGFLLAIITAVCWRRKRPRKVKASRPISGRRRTYTPQSLPAANIRRTEARRTSHVN